MDLVPEFTDITIVFSDTFGDGQEIYVTIPGRHTGDEPDFNPLNHELSVMVPREDGYLVPMGSSELRKRILDTTITALYVDYGTPATSSGPISTINSHQLLPLPTFGITGVTVIGKVELLDEEEIGIDTYLIAIANPAEHVHLLVIIEIIDTKRGDSRAVDLTDTGLINMIRTRLALDLGMISEADLLESIGNEDDQAIESEDDTFEEEKGDEDTVDSSDTVVQRQCWTMDPEN